MDFKVTLQRLKNTDLDRLKKLKSEFGDKVEYGFQKDISEGNAIYMFVLLLLVLV